MTPDPLYYGTTKWREHKAPSDHFLHLMKLKTIEAWRDYLFSGRDYGTTRAYYDYGDAIVTVTITRREQSVGFVDDE